MESTITLPDHVTVFDDRAALTRAAAEYCTAACQTDLAAAAEAHWALAGGSTPRALYQLLAEPAFRDAAPWERVQFYFGDERAVPPDHPDSNFRMARDAWLQNLPAEHVHRMAADPAYIRAGAQRYHQLLALRLPHTPAGVPRFDLVLLGVGADGHTASLFPATCILREQDRWAAAVYVDKLRAWRISLTLPVINAARRVLILVAGSDKQAIVKDLFGAAAQTQRYPVQAVQPAGELHWYLDRDAAGELYHA